VIPVAGEAPTAGPAAGFAAGLAADLELGLGPGFGQPSGQRIRWQITAGKELEIVKILGMKKFMGTLLKRTT
jgi:hypothetical protein